MQKLKWLLRFALLLFSAQFVYSQESWDPAFSSLDVIEQNVLKLQNSNEILIRYNMSLSERLNDSEGNVKILMQISLQQSELLSQWEDNWTQTQEILTIQSMKLESYEKLCNGLKIGLPIAITVSIGIGILIGVMINANK